MAAAGGAVRVVSVNLCVLASGLTNRYLPRQLLLASAAGAVALALCLSPSAGPLSRGHALLLVPLALPAVCWALGVPLARALGALLGRGCGLDDFKRQRVDLFLQLLRESSDLADADVVCVQECYGALLCPGGYPRRLAEGAAALGYVHAVVPSRCPFFPAWLALNSGLLILSRRRIVSFAELAFGIHTEAGNVNRGAMHAELEGGLHVFTTHMSPCPDVTGAFAGVVGPLFDMSRRRQTAELARFVSERAPPGSPAVLAGDLNLDVSFGAAAAPAPSAYAVRLLVRLAAECGLVHAAAQARGTTGAGAAWAPGGADGRALETLRLCRPTFGYAEGCPGSAERWLTSYGKGGPQQLKCDDAILSRGLVAVDFQELPLALPEHLRPHPRVTHLSDHWAVRATLRPG